MTPRPRKRKNAALPPNLYSSKRDKWTSYRYRHPVTKKEHGMGSDKAKAIAAAKQLNNMLMTPNDLVSQVMQSETVADHIDWFFREIIPTKEYAKNTITMYRGKCNKLKTEIGSQELESISVKDIADILEKMTPRAAQQLRQVAIDVFKTAIGRGLIETNPAEQTNKPVSKKTRQRLTREQYDAIYDLAPLWLKNAMQIGLLSLQRREDISKMRFDGIKDGYLFVIQEKTKKYDTGYLKIEVGAELAKAISKCRDNIPSPYLIHRKPEKKIKREDCDHWTQVTAEMITRKFKEVRDNVELFDSVPMNIRPTFHEIRALGIKEYKDSGFEPQQLAGHSDQKMTKNYDSGHDEIRWIETKTR